MRSGDDSFAPGRHQADVVCMRTRVEVDFDPWLHLRWEAGRLIEVEGANEAGAGVKGNSAAV